MNYIKYYSVQSGQGYSDENFGPLLRSQRIYQKGRGLGGFFGGLFRYLRPLLTSAFNGLKSEVLQTGADILHGKPINEALRDRSIQVIDKLRDKATEKVKQMAGSGFRKRLKKSIKGCLRGSCKQSKPGRGTRRKRKKSPKKKGNKKRVIDIFS